MRHVNRDNFPGRDVPILPKNPRAIEREIYKGKVEDGTLTPWFLGEVNQVDPLQKWGFNTVDGRNPAPPGMYKPCK